MNLEDISSHLLQNHAWSSGDLEGTGEQLLGLHDENFPDCAYWEALLFIHVYQERWPEQTVEDVLKRVDRLQAGDSAGDQVDEALTVMLALADIGFDRLPTPPDYAHMHQAFTTGVIPEDGPQG